MIENPETLTGVVLNGAHGIYDVHTDIGILRCTLRGKLKKDFAHAQSNKSFNQARPRADKLIALSKSQRTALKEQQIEALPTRLTVGDFVKLRQLDGQNGLIEEILPRQSALSRKDVGSTEKRAIKQTLLANLDQVALVFACAQPEPHFGMVDRYLAICESAGIQAVICLNKADLPHPTYVDQAATLYAALGYTVIWTSVLTGQGIEALQMTLRDHTTLFTGPSGVGKSSLVNVIEPGMAIKTGLVSESTGKGKHTTTGSQLYPLSGGGWLADSAGIRALAAWDIAPEDLADCFVEFRPYLGECLYTDCQHLEEQHCAIRQAVADGVIDTGRYRSYERILMGEER
ncbi:MAG TPA: ribosome small subunit-dependent GTPase A [Ktedonobacteraceae bacterium]|nr:ribosome small subunit-dependent GTPase A [Ktedonobacteraceae bacterium]